MNVEEWRDRRTDREITIISLCIILIMVLYCIFLYMEMIE